MQETENTLGAALDRLAGAIATRRGAPAETSYTAKLLQAGPSRCAKKLGEEGVEAALAVASGGEEEIAEEAADLVYHLLVALASRGVSPNAVAAVLAGREGRSGLEEQAARRD